MKQFWLSFYGLNMMNFLQICPPYSLPSVKLEKLVVGE